MFIIYIFLSCSDSSCLFSLSYLTNITFSLCCYPPSPSLPCCLSTLSTYLLLSSKIPVSIVFFIRIACNWFSVSFYPSNQTIAGVGCFFVSVPVSLLSINWHLLFTESRVTNFRTKHTENEEERERDRGRERKGRERENEKMIETNGLIEAISKQLVAIYYYLCLACIVQKTKLLLFPNTWRTIGHLSFSSIVVFCVWLFTRHQTQNTHTQRIWTRIRNTLQHCPLKRSIPANLSLSISKESVCNIYTQYLENN